MSEQLLPDRAKDEVRSSDQSDRLSTDHHRCAAPFGKRCHWHNLRLTVEYRLSTVSKALDTDLVARSTQTQG